MTDMTAAGIGHADFGPAQVARGRGNGRLPQRRLNTPRRRAFLEVLEGADGFLSVVELYGRLCAYLAPQGLRVGIATVYNQVRGLAESGAVGTPSW